jgi:protein translocase SecG subunit
MLYYLVVTLYILTCGLLIITILLQQGKGGDIANAFGGGTSQAVFGARSGATLLTARDVGARRAVRDSRAQPDDHRPARTQFGGGRSRRPAACRAGRADADQRNTDARGSGHAAIGK